MSSVDSHRRALVLGAVATSLVSLFGACKSKPAEASADGTILSPYLVIGEILAADEIDEVAALGAAIVEASAKQAEAPGVAEILAAASRIGAADISTTRLAYRKMSEGVIAWLGAHPDQREGLVLVYCPMAFTNEGAYWVQRTGQLANPYEGAMMLRCGAKIGWDDHRRGQPPTGDAKLEGMDK